LSSGAACAFVFIALACFATGCEWQAAKPKQPLPLIEVTSPPQANLVDGCVANFHESVDYFPERTTFRHSSQLSVAYERNYKRITFRPAIATDEAVEILLVQCGTPVPPHGPNSVVVSVPVTRIASASSAMLGAAAELGVVDRFVGLSDPRKVTVPAFQERIRQGAIASMGGHGHGNIEPIIGADPDVYFTFYSAYPQYNIHPRLWSMGIRAVPHADSVEATPLGRAEWIKLLALLTNTEARANQAFDQVERAYLEAARIVSASIDRPTVLAGTASQRDVMELFGGANHRAALIRDAGGRFVLENDRFPGSWLITPFERVYAAGADAAYWIGTRPGIQTVGALIAANPHHRWFEAAVGNGDVYALDLGYRGMFAYHLEDQGMNNPHRQLVEIAAILQPQLADRLDVAHPLFVRKLK
jgi:iron complex transport system substrate-binding protein